MDVPALTFWVDRELYLYSMNWGYKKHWLSLYIFKLPEALILTSVWQVSDLQCCLINHGPQILNHQIECAVNALGSFRVCCYKSRHERAKLWDNNWSYWQWNCDKGHIEIDSTGTVMVSFVLTTGGIHSVFCVDRHDCTINIPKHMYIHNRSCRAFTPCAPSSDQRIAQVKCTQSVAGNVIA